MNSTYWLGPYDIKVPLELVAVRSADGGNLRYKDGRETEMYVPARLALNREQYLLKYGTNLGTQEHPDWWYLRDESKK